MFIILPILLNNLNANRGDINAITYDLKTRQNKGTIYDQMQKERALYPNFDGNTIGLNLAIHTFHSYQISIKDYSFDGTRYHGNLHYVCYDHFGLDSGDIDRPVGFNDWFALQHHDRYDGKYKPFISIVEFDVPFSGVIK